MYKYLAAFLIAGLAFLPGQAHAGPMNYDLTLTDSTTQTVVGTGGFTIASAPNTVPGVVTMYTSYSPNAPMNLLTNLHVSIGGYTFGGGITDVDGGFEEVYFTGGQLSHVQLFGLIQGGFFSTEGGTTYQFVHGTAGSAGNITAAPAPTPEPGSLLLLATGSLGLVGVVRERLAGRREGDVTL